MIHTAARPLEDMPPNVVEAAAGAPHAETPCGCLRRTRPSVRHQPRARAGMPHMPHPAGVNPNALCNAPCLQSCRAALNVGGNGSALGHCHELQHAALHQTHAMQQLQASATAITTQMTGSRRQHNNTTACVCHHHSSGCCLPIIVTPTDKGSRGATQVVM